MKLKTQSAQVQIVRELLGLAVIGFVLWLAAIGWLPLTAANAATGAPQHGDPEKRLARMQAQLNLSSEQVDQLRPILENQEAKRRQLRDKFRGQGRRAMRAEMQSLWEETEKALAAVLTEDQMAKWRQLREERRRERQNRRSAKPHP